MARMHTRKKGKSKSRRVYSDAPMDWLQVSKHEIRNMVVEMRKSGLSKSMIGIKLRDQYGVPGTKPTLNKKVSTVLREAGIKESVPEDLMSLINRYKNVAKHNELNPKDQSNIRGQALIMSKILRLVKYYKREGYLAPEWNLSKVL